MGKDTHLVNIYLKIHHKKVLTMDDLRYLAESFMNMADDRKDCLRFWRHMILPVRKNARKN